MHFVDRAREYKAMSDFLNITPYEYARANNLKKSSVLTYTRFLSLSDKVLDQIKESEINFNIAGLLIKLRKTTSDERINRLIRFIMHKKLDYYNARKHIDYEMEKGRR